MKKARKFHSLTVTLAIAFLALSVVVLLIASSLSMYFSFQNQQKLIINEQRFIAQNAANTVKSFVQENLGILERSAAIGSLATAGQEEQKTVLERLLGKVPSFRQLVLLDAQKQELAKVSRLSNLVSYGFIKQIGSDIFSQVSQGKMYISSVYIEEVTSEPMVIMAVPVKDIFGDFKETLIAEVNLKFMWDLVGGIKVGNKGLAYVVDKQGNLIASGDISRVLKGENLVYLSEVNEFVKGNILTHKDSAGVVKGIQGNLVVANHAHLGTPDWAVVVELPVLEAYETVITTLITSGLIMLLSFALAIIAGIYLSKRITKPIISLRDAAVRIGEGRLDTQIEIKKNDEIGDLAAAFNQMTENLHKTTTSIDNLNREMAERKKAEEALRESEQRLNIVLNSILTGVVVVDAETHKIVDANPLATKLIGLPREKIVGKLCHKFICPAEEGKCPISDLGQTVDQSERVLIRGNGKEIQILKTVTPTSWQGRSFFVESFIDITERKQAEQRQAELLQQLEKVNQELKDFAYVVSHDLKAPLRGIKNLADWISTDYADKLDDNGKEQMNLLASRVDRMRRPH